ncbi:hypothetical protein CN186_26830, partial [Sinorhizobium medicae]
LRLPANCSPSQTPSSGTKQPSDEPPDKHSCQPDQVLGMEDSLHGADREWEQSMSSAVSA